MEKFDTLAMQFLEDHSVPGMALAVVDHGKLVYARGFGYADISEQEKVTSTHLFRVASISKPITAVAILKLIQDGKLQLDAPVYSLLDFEKEIEAAGTKFDTRQRSITIRHLLQHRGGWDRDKSFDAMFQAVRFAREQGVEAPAMQDTVIKQMLYQELDFAPGERYAYSNFGYCLLGRVIEKLTGRSYEKYVQEEVLKPLGIHTMRLGKSLADQRVEHEVKYYNPGRGKSVFQANLNAPVPWQYGGWTIEAMDSHGGWIASAEDLAKFVSAFDDPSNCPILNKQMIELMWERPDGKAGYEEDGKPKEVFYSLGWLNRVVGDDKVNRWHTGSLDGTATIMIRRYDGRNMVALLNSRASSSATHLGRALDQLLHQAADATFKP